MGYTTARQIKDMYRKAMQEVNVPEDIQKWALHTQRLHRAIHKHGAQVINGQLCIDDDSVCDLMETLMSVGPVYVCLQRDDYALQSECLEGRMREITEVLREIASRGCSAKSIQHLLGESHCTCPPCVALHFLDSTK